MPPVSSLLSEAPSRCWIYYAMRSSMGEVATGPKLSPEALLILTSLADGTKHGYAIQQDIAGLSGRRLGPGSLYGAIARLEAAGYIAAADAEGPRRPYSLTAAGSRALAEAVESLQKVVTTAAHRLATR
jgi:DNA-binding PadR family transcriptional regulator